MSVKLAFVSVLVFLTIIRVRGDFPAPQPPAGPRSQCGVWSSADQIDGIRSVSAKRVRFAWGFIFFSPFFLCVKTNLHHPNQLTASHTSALEQTMIKRSTLHSRGIRPHIPVSELST